MKVNRRMFLTACAAVALVSCVSDLETDVGKKTSGDTEFVDATVSVSCDKLESKAVSVLDTAWGAEESKIYNWSVAIYDNETSELVYCEYDIVSGADFLIRNKLKPNRLYDVYAYANAQHGYFPEFPDNNADGRLRAMSYLNDTGKNFAITVKKSGIPMSGHTQVKFNLVNDNCSIRLERLFAKLTVNIKNPLKDFPLDFVVPEYRARVLNTSGRLAFFDTVRRTEQDTDCYADEAVFSEADRTNDYISFNMYVPENMQGDLLPDNTDCQKKSAEYIDNIDGKDYSGLCTYVELRGNVHDEGQGYGGEVIYRYYLGRNSTGNFDVERNSHYTINLSYTVEGLFVDSWKVDKGESWHDDRKLYFIDDEVYIYSGRNASLNLYYSKMPDMDHTNSDVYDPGESLRSRFFRIHYDKAKAAELGLSVDDALGVGMGANGYNVFVKNIRPVSAALTAAGEALMVYASTPEGAICDSVRVFVVGSLESTWEEKPQYVSQFGKLTMTDDREYVCDDYDSDALRVERNTDKKSFTVTLLKTGEYSLHISSTDGFRDGYVSVVSRSPSIVLSDSYVRLNPDGSPARVEFTIVDDNKEILKNCDENVLRQAVIPGLARGYDYDYFSSKAVYTVPCRGYIDLWICRLNTGRKIRLGYVYYVDVMNGSDTMNGTFNIEVVNPFAGLQTGTCTVDDYTLLDYSPYPAVREYFRGKIQSGRIVTIPVATGTYGINAADECIRAVLARADNGYEFTDDNGVWYAEYNKGSAGKVIYVKQNDIDVATPHYAGPMKLIYYVYNSHSNESIDFVGKNISVYLHNAVGAMADLGHLSNFELDSSEFYSGMYEWEGNEHFFYEYYLRGYKGSYMRNGYEVYFGYPNGYVYYDLYVNYLVPMVNSSKELKAGLFNHLLNSKGNRYNSYELICAGSHPDIYTVNESMEWVYQSGIQSINRGGISENNQDNYSLFRKVSRKESTTSMTYNQLNNAIGFPYTAPEYYVNDVNTGKQIDRSSGVLYYTPKTPRYTDNNGKGYYVIHCLDKIVPESHGWINLLDKD